MNETVNQRNQMAASFPPIRHDIPESRDVTHTIASYSETVGTTAVNETSRTFDAYIKDHFMCDYAVFLQDKLNSRELSIGRICRDVPEPDEVIVEDASITGTRFTMIERDTVHVQAAVRLSMYLFEICGRDKFEGHTSELYKVSGHATLHEESCEFSLFEDARVFDSWDQPDGILLSNQLLPVIYWADQEKAAEWILARYYPEALMKPTRINPKVLAERIGLTLEYARLSPDGSILGQMVFDSTPVTTYAKDGRTQETTLVDGDTAIVDADASRKATGRIYPTVVHECLHGATDLLFYRLMKLYGIRVNALTCERNTPESDSTVLSRIEKQTNQMVPRLMAPKDMLERKYNEILSRKRECCPDMDSLLILEKAVGEIAEFFCISKQSAKLRLRDLGHNEVEGVHNYVGKKYIPNYCCAVRQPCRNQTYTITLDALRNEYRQNPAFRSLLDSGRFAFAEFHLCLNDGAYITRSEDGVIQLTTYARRHMDECCLVFTITCNSNTYGYSTNSLHREAAPIGGKIIFFPGKSAAEAAAAKESPFQAAQRISAIKQGLPRSLGATLHYHMDRLGITKEELEERSQVSARTIQRIINNDSKSVQLSYIVSLCIGLNLDPELSDDMVSKAGYVFRDTEEDVIYEIILRSMYNMTMADCNEVLMKEGYPPLTKLAAAM